jgi:hypothetical protein
LQVSSSATFGGDRVHLPECEVTEVERLIAVAVVRKNRGAMEGAPILV